MKQLLFYLVIFASNVIQGITGFAGTILAMPPSLLLVGYPVAKPILNFLGLLAGVYVFAGNYRKVSWREVRRIVFLMLPGICAGIPLQRYAAGNVYLYGALAAFVLFLSVQGAVKMRRESAQSGSGNAQDAGCGNAENDGSGSGLCAGNTALLLAAGLVHGVFVSGGPLLIGYLAGRLPEKESFRATISTVWIVLNSVIFIGDIAGGSWNPALILCQAGALPFFFGGMFLGGLLCKRMSQRAFLWLTYLLLFISGILLLAKIF